MIVIIGKKKYDAIGQEIVRLKNHIAGIENDLQMLKKEVRMKNKNKTK